MDMGIVPSQAVPKEWRHLPQSVFPFVSRYLSSPHEIKPKLKLPITDYPNAVHYYEDEPSRVWKPAAGVSSCVDFMQTYDDLFNRHAHFYPDNHQDIKDTILIIPGKSVPIEGVQTTIDQFVLRGNQVFTMDLRSQGLSSRPFDGAGLQKVHVESFDQYALDFAQHLEQRVLPQKKGKLVVIGYSTGAAIAVTAIGKGLIDQSQIDFLVPVAPLVRAKDFTKHKGIIAAKSARVLCDMGYGSSYFWTTGDRKWDEELEKHHIYTFDRESLQSVADRSRREPRLLSGGPTFSWVKAHNGYFKLTKHIPKNAITIPTVLFLAQSDEVVHNEHSMMFFERAIGHKPDVVWVDAAHALELAHHRTLIDMNSSILRAANAACLAAA